MSTNIKLPEPLGSMPAEAGRRREVPRGSHVFRQEEPTGALHVLVSGAVELSRTTEAGEHVVIHRARAGETFAEAALFSEEYHCDAVATADSTIIAFDRTLVLSRFAADPDFAKSLAHWFARQVQGYRRRLEIHAIKRADERVLAAFAAGMATSDLKTLAAEIGLTHEAVYRALKRLTTDGRIRKTGRGSYALTS